MNSNEIPIIITSYNRLTCLKELLTFLERTVTNPIVILDNQSTYEPLLEYYKTCPHEIIHLGSNLGHEALWKSGHINRFKNSHFVVTDPDVVPVDECPADFMQHFLNLMNKYPKFTKVGFGLKIDDIPDHFPHKGSVQNWEAQFWQTKMEEGVWKAQIDTTFALFHPNHKGSWGWALRTDHPYIARHKTWYLNPEDLPDDEKYYQSIQKTITHWSGKL